MNQTIHLDDKLTHDHRCCVIPLVKTLVSLSAQVKILTHKNNRHNSRRQFWFIELTLNCFFFTKSHDFDYSSTFRIFSTKTSTFSANYKDFDFLHEFLLTHQPLTQKPVNKQLFFLRKQYKERIERQPRKLGTNEKHSFQV